MITVNKGWFKKGQIPWNKDKKIIKSCYVCLSNFSGRGIKFCSLQCAGKAKKGIHYTDTSGFGRTKGCVPYNKGKKSPETSGERNGKWIKDRTIILEKHRLRGTEE